MEGCKAGRGTGREEGMEGGREADREEGMEGLKEVTERRDGGRETDEWI